MGGPQVYSLMRSVSASAQRLIRPLLLIRPLWRPRTQAEIKAPLKSEDQKDKYVFPSGVSLKRRVEKRIRLTAIMGPCGKPECIFILHNIKWLASISY